MTKKEKDLFIQGFAQGRSTIRQRAWVVGIRLLAAFYLMTYISDGLEKYTGGYGVLVGFIVCMFTWYVLNYTTDTIDDSVL